MAIGLQLGMDVQTSLRLAGYMNCIKTPSSYYTKFSDIVPRGICVGIVILKFLQLNTLK